MVLYPEPKVNNCDFGMHNTLLYKFWLMIVTTIAEFG